MFAIGSMILNAVLGSAIGRAVLFGAVLFLLGWVKGYNMAADYTARATAENLKAIIAEKDRIIDSHQKQVEEDEKTTASLAAEIETMIHGSKSDSCAFTDSQLAELQRLSSRAR